MPMDWSTSSFWALQPLRGFCVTNASVLVRSAAVFDILCPCTVCTRFATQWLREPTRRSMILRLCHMDTACRSCRPTRRNRLQGFRITLRSWSDNGAAHLHDHRGNLYTWIPKQVVWPHSKPDMGVHCHKCSPSSMPIGHIAWLLQGKHDTTRHASTLFICKVTVNRVCSWTSHRHGTGVQSVSSRCTPLHLLPPFS